MVIAVISGKGGTAKTTTALHLAACLHEGGVKSLLVDMERLRYLSGYKALRWPRIIAADDKSLPAILADNDRPHAILDVGCNENHYAIAAIEACDVCVVPLAPDRDALDGALLICQSARRRHTPARLLLTRYSPRYPEFRQFRHDALQQWDSFTTAIPHSLSFQRARLSGGGTVLDFAPQGAAANAYRKVTREMILWQSQL